MWTPLSSMKRPRLCRQHVRGCQERPLAAMLPEARGVTVHHTAALNVETGGPRWDLFDGPLMQGVAVFAHGQAQHPQHKLQQEVPLQLRELMVYKDAHACAGWGLSSRNDFGCMHGCNHGPMHWLGPDVGSRLIEIAGLLWRPNEERLPLACLGR